MALCCRWWHGSVVAAITRCVWRRPLGATRTPVGPPQSKRHVQPCTRLSSHRCPPCYGMYGSGQSSYSDPEQAGLELDRGHLREHESWGESREFVWGVKRQNKKKDNDWSKLSSSFFLVWRVPLWLAYVLSSAGQVGIICWFYAENLPILCQKFAHFTVLQRMKIPDRVRSWRIECLQNSLFYCQNGYWFLFLSSWSLNPIHMPLFFIFDVIIFKFSIWNLPDPSCYKTEIYICCFISRCASLHAPRFEVSKPIRAMPLIPSSVQKFSSIVIWWCLSSQGVWVCLFICIFVDHSHPDPVCWSKLVTCLCQGPKGLRWAPPIPAAKKATIDRPGATCHYIDLQTVRRSAQIQLHKYTNTNTQIQIQKYKYKNTYTNTQTNTHIQIHTY